MAILLYVREDDTNRLGFRVLVHITRVKVFLIFHPSEVTVVFKVSIYGHD